MEKRLSRGITAAVIISMAATSAPLPAQAASKLSVKDCIISRGDKIDLDVSDAKETSGKYTSSKKSVATVNKKGVVTAKKTGDVKISWKKGKKKYTCKVKVVKAPSLEGDKTKTSLSIGQEKKLTVNKYGNKKLSVKWSSSDKSIVKTNGNKITGIAEGEAVVKARIKGYSKTWTKSITVTVQKDKEPAASPGGTPGTTLSPSGTGTAPDASGAPEPGTTIVPGTSPVPENTAVPDTTTAPGTTTAPDATATPGATQAPGTTASPSTAPSYPSPGPGGLIIGGTSPTAAPSDDIYKGYKLVWQDEFNGTSLNRDDWNVELHEPGWVNAELQEYVDSDKNIYIEDGKLVLKPIKTADESGKVSYTSGRVNTQNKHNFKYGLFEARVKVPEGKGFLPAFWMMPANENLYGQWPRCGELDIMEVMGQDTKKSYGTIHYGNPHNESQGTHVLESGSFSEDYHTFSAEWEPGKIKWYVDGRLIHTTDDWYSVTEGQGEITYPAPFDQPFYIIFNLAVGGSWVGYPDETTDINSAAYMVDYVRVYQKDSYNENVKKPVKDIVLRDPDKDGNYVNNGNFGTAEDLSDEKDWKFLTALEGEGTAEIKNNEIVASTTNEGTADYSIQLVQPGLPMKKGGQYKLTFDAYADAARTMKVDVSAPDRGYSRYLADTTVDLTTEKQTYTYEFTMTGNDDANGRLEYNLGKAGSTAGVHISNVSLVKTGEIDMDKLDKTVLADGNCVYNGAFQEGEDRMAYWDITANGAEVSVTNTDNIRRLKITIPEGATDKPVLVSQKDMAIQGGNNYVLAFDAEGKQDGKITVTVAGKEFEAGLAGAEKGYSYKFVTEKEPANKDIVFKFNSPGTYYLDNVRIDEDSLIKNGSFNAGFSGYEPYVDGSADASYVVDSISEENAADFTINNTGDAAWKIQLKQNNVELEKGQWYKLSFDAKASVARKIMFAIQRDGSSDDNWDPYSGEKIIDLGSEYKNYNLVFQMTKETDLHSILSISMGAVGGTQITNKHRICIDNILLEKTSAPAMEEKPAGENLIKNASFESGKEYWEGGITSPGGGTEKFEDGKAVYEITNTGTEDWNIQLRQTGIQLEKGSRYKLVFKANSTVARNITVNFMSTSYDWYAGSGIELTAEEKDAGFEFIMEKDTNNNAGIFISMGKMKDSSGQYIDTPASTITLSGFKLEKVS